MNRKRSAKISHVTEILGEYFAEHGLLAKSQEMLAAFVWAEVVGPWYAQHTQVTRIKDGVLMVHCDSAPRAQQLQLDSAFILQNLNQRLGGEFIREIRAASGRVGRGRPDPTLYEAPGEELPSAAELARFELSGEESEIIAGLSQKLEDEALRRRFAAAMQNFCRLQQWRRAQGYQPCRQCGRLVAPGRRCPVCFPGRMPQQGNPDFDESNDSYGGG